LCGYYNSINIRIWSLNDARTHIIYLFKLSVIVNNYKILCNNNNNFNGLKIVIIIWILKSISRWTEKYIILDDNNKSVARKNVII